MDSRRRLLGLSLVTYQPSRAMPLLVVLWIVYLAIFHKEPLARQWKGLTVFGIAAAVTAAPLTIYLLTHPGAESGRAFQAEPVQQLFKGVLGPMIGHVLATLKMFTFYGDPQPLYNVPGRPALTPLTGLTFYAGLIIALIRFKRQEYALIVLWLVAALAPALVTFPAPNFPRTLLAHCLAAIIAIPIIALGDAGRADHQVCCFACSGNPRHQPDRMANWNDYFTVGESEERASSNARPAAAERYLDASMDTDPVILAGLFVDDSDPYNFEVTLHRKDLDLRWFDASSALPILSNTQTIRLVLYDFTPIDDTLSTRYLSSKVKLEEQTGFSVFRLDTKTLSDMVYPTGNITLHLIHHEIASFVWRCRCGLRCAISDRTRQDALLTRWRINSRGTSQPVAIFNTEPERQNRGPR
jgi:hypothetical protein